MREIFPTIDLKVGAAVIDVAQSDKENNLHKVASIVEQADADTDLIVLPEMFSTGFVLDTTELASLAEENPSPTVTLLENLARTKGICICGTYIAKEGGEYYNRGFMISGEGEPTEYYDKKHLFGLGGESRIYTPGNKPSPIFEIKGWRLKMAICYDLRFPVWNRSKGLEYDCLVVPANWASARSYAWHHLLIGRSIENQAYTIGANRVGNDFYGAYNEDDIVIYDHMGRDVSDRSRKDSGIIYSVFDADKLKRDRSRFTAWRDVDRFELLQ